MAVYTALDDGVLEPWLAAHCTGELVDCRGIASGIENSNFFVTTDDRGTRRDFVLTIFERLSDGELDYCLALMDHLAARGVPCPAPMADGDGALCMPLAGKPAALVTRLAGRHVLRPDRAQCAAMGRTLAAMHLGTEDFGGAQLNPRGIDWWIETAARVRGFLDDGQRALLDDEVALQADSWRTVTGALPSGAIHADLFRDNALFVDDGPVVGGVIDFYFAGDDVRVLDLAICLNDWCVDLDDGAFDPTLLGAFLDAYGSVRPLTRDELDALPQMLRAAALRFWLSRVDDLHRPRPAELLTPHDPTRFERILRRRRTEATDGSTPVARWSA
jgi:homoserine kinase type II